MDLEIFSSPEHSEKEEVTLMMAVEAQPEVLEEPSSSNFVSGVLRELTPEEEVAKSGWVEVMTPINLQLLLLKETMERISRQTSQSSSLLLK